MKNIYEVLRQKEEQSEQLQKEIEVLRHAAKILDAADTVPTILKTDSRSNGSSLVSEAASVASGATTKRFP
jgi:DNA repair ATPase RecN